MKTAKLLARPTGLSLALVVVGAAAFACSDDDPSSGPKPLQNVTDGGEQVDGAVAAQPTKLSRASRGSAVDISEDDSIVVAVNRDSGTLSIFDVAQAGEAAPTLTKKGEVQVCAEPWQVVLAPNGDRAFVVCRKDQKLVRVDALRSSPVKGPEVAVGSEPTGVALTPKATAVWVANWVDGTTSEVDAEKMTVVSTIDLNAALVATGTLGSVTSRPALAHPRSIAITNNKDDLENDESIFVTEYFGQQKEQLASNGSNADIAKQGFVYRISLSDKSVKTIPLPPITDTGIQDHAGGVVGCYPNQLQSVDVQGSFAYVTSVCASPKGPFAEFTGPAKVSCAADATCPGAQAGSCDVANSVCKTNCTTNAECGVNGGVCENFTCKLNLWDAKAIQTPAISVIDIGADKVIASVALNSEFEKSFVAAGLPDTTARRFPLHVTDLAFVPGTLVAYAAAKGADAVYRVEFNATYETKAVDAVGSPNRPFIPLDVGTLDATKQGKTPIGIAMAHKAKPSAPAQFAYVLNESSRNVTVLDLKKDDIAGLPDQAAVVSSTAMPSTAEEKDKVEGRRLFNTGLGRWSLNGQAWGACETCHFDGYSDQVTWFHLRGARQTPSLDQTVDKKTGKSRLQNWNANADEIEDHEGGALRGALGGTGAIVKSFDLTLAARIPFDTNGQAGLNGSATAAADPQSPSTLVSQVNVLEDWKKIASFIKSIRSPNKPSNLDGEQVAAGKTLFEQANCQGCHGGNQWTLSNRFYTPDPDVASPTNINKALKTRSWTTAVTSANFPVALLPTADAPSQTMRYSGGNPAALDSMTCLLRPVGTFGVAEPGVGVAELRRNHQTPAQGDEASGKGFNVPSLIGVAVNAPYFHAGNARTLEALLSDPFSAHHQALSASFLSDAEAPAKRAKLVQFLLSIDAETTAISLPALGPTGGDFCSSP